MSSGKELPGPAGERGVYWPRLLGTPVRQVQLLKGGSNSRVFRVRGENGTVFAAKQYFRHPADPRDRFQNETAALRALRRHGVRNIPELLAADREAGVAVFEWIPGRPPDAVSMADICQAADFLCRLKELADGSDFADFPPASEAFFCAREIIANISARLARFAAVPRDCPQRGELEELLERGFRPALNKYAEHCRGVLAQGGVGFDADLPREERTLSPSDFGFHNALRRADGSLCFLDLEYFGWDDPAKTLSDFALHPAMRLNDDHLRLFMARVLAKMDAGGRLRIRARAYYPLFRLKWCLIMLNEFLPEESARRQFAGSSPANPADKLGRQLDLARATWGKISEGYERFVSFLA